MYQKYARESTVCSIMPKKNKTTVLKRKKQITHRILTQLGEILFLRLVTESQTIAAGEAQQKVVT